jgi:hypothetical protein
VCPAVVRRRLGFAAHSVVLEQSCHASIGMISNPLLYLCRPIHNKCRINAGTLHVIDKQTRNCFLVSLPVTIVC